MSYFGTTQGTASWLIGKPGALDALHDALTGLDASLTILSDKEFVEGPMRLSASSTPSLVSGWNVEYTSGLGDDPWGFINLDVSWGIAARPDISREVLERCLYLISQRLQGLLIDGAYIHRAWPNGSHTCLAGRGTEARQVSVAYVEREVADGATALRTILCIGPEYNLGKLNVEAARRADLLSELLPMARRLYDPARRKPVLGASELPNLRRAFSPYLQPLSSGEFADVNVATALGQVPEREGYRTTGWNYRTWLGESSPLSAVLRRLLVSPALDSHPVRIIGPAGSGKTLLMELLALRRLELAAEAHRPARILYLVHNAKMAETVKLRFSTLTEGLDLLNSQERTLTVQTLTEYGLTELSLTEEQIIDPDAYLAKEFQLETMSKALVDAIDKHPQQVAESRLFQQATSDPALMKSSHA